MEFLTRGMRIVCSQSLSLCNGDKWNKTFTLSFPLLNCVMIWNNEIIPNIPLQLHKAWLERRAMMKAQEGALNNNNTQKLYYFNKRLSNLKLNTSSAANFQRKHKKFRAQQNEVIIDSDSSLQNLTQTTNLSTISNGSEYSTMYPITTPFDLTSSTVANTFDTTVVTPPTLNTTKYDKQTKKDRPNKSRRRQVIWGAWHPWSECSRSCGSGVMSQSRDCIR